VSDDSPLWAVWLLGMHGDCSTPQFSSGQRASFICYVEKETPIFTLLELLDKKLFL
jgi:hypothetical protein